MARPVAGKPAAEPRRGESTRVRLVQAAIETLKRVGYAGASARVIAATGGFNQALIFYHFGTVNDLLLAALDETSAQRMKRYRTAMGSVTGLPELMRLAAEIYREDLESGHIKVLAELIAGSSSSPELGPRIVERIEPWVRFTEEAIARVLSGSQLETFMPSRDLAYAIVALYLGIELLTHLEGDGSRAEALLETGSRVAQLASTLLGVPNTMGA